MFEHCGAIVDRASLPLRVITRSFVLRRIVLPARERIRAAASASYGAWHRGMLHRGAKSMTHVILRRAAKRTGVRHDVI